MEDWPAALVDADEALRLARADPSAPAKTVQHMEHFRLHVSADAEKAKGSDEGEIRITIQVMVETRFQDMHLDWQIEDMTHHGDLLVVKFLPSNRSFTRWMVFKLYGPKAIRSMVWFDQHDETMDLIQKDPEADLDEMVSLIHGPVERHETQLPPGTARAFGSLLLFIISIFALRNDTMRIVTLTAIIALGGILLCTTTLRRSTFRARTTTIILAAGALMISVVRLFLHR
jgi:hypothetical protein